MDSGEDVAARKRALRERLLAARRQHGRAARTAAAEGLRDQVLGWLAQHRVTCVAAYVSVGHEPGTGPLLEALHARGLVVLLPVVLPDLDLDWAPYEGPDRLVEARRGLLEPRAERWGPAGVARADALVVPATAADLAGHRLGQGGGCYDRALVRVPAGVPVAALVHDEEVLGSVPHAPHDRRVDAVVTPTRALADLGHVGG